MAQTRAVNLDLSHMFKPENAADVDSPTKAKLEAAAKVPSRLQYSACISLS